MKVRPDTRGGDLETTFQWEKEQGICGYFKYSTQFTSSDVPGRKKKKKDTYKKIYKKNAKHKATCFVDVSQYYFGGKNDCF